jgi:hypothetical protein
MSNFHSHKFDTNHTQSIVKMIRTQISSSLDELNRLHELYTWIPNESMIRPTQENIQKKQQIILHIQNQWQSTRDYILYHVFNQHIKIHSITGKVFVPITNIEKSNQWTLQPCMFPYAIPKHAHHDVLWNSEHLFEKEFDPEFINTQITTILQSRLNNDNFDFAWYKNPKPSVLDFYHVQVFWIPTTQ